MEFFIILFVIMGCLVFTSIKVIKEHENGVVNTLSNYTAVIQPGLMFSIPFIQNIEKVDMRERRENLKTLKILSTDNATITMDVDIYFKVTNPMKALSEVQNFSLATLEKAKLSLKSAFEQYDLDDTLSLRRQISDDVKHQLNREVNNWGLEIVNIEILEINS